MFNVTPHLVENIDYHTYDFEIPYVVVNVKEAWDLPGEEAEVLVADLEHTLYEESWEGETPIDGGIYEPHWSLTLVADTSYPIIITREPGKEHCTVVDGRHRLLKAWLLGHETIPTKYIEYEALLRGAGITIESMGTVRSMW